MLAHSEIFSFSKWKIYLIACLLAFLTARMLMAYQFPVNVGIILGILLVIASVVYFDYAVIFWASVSIAGDFLGMEVAWIPRLYLSEIMLCIVFSVWFIKALINNKFSFLPDINAGLFLFLSWGMLAVMLSAALYNSDASLLHALRVRFSGYSLLLFAFMAYILTINYALADARNISRIIRGIFISFYVIGPLHLFVSLILGHTWDTLPEFYAIMGGNFLGAYYNIISILSLSFLFIPGETKARRYFYCATLCLAAVATVLLDEKMSLVILFASSMAILFLKNRKVFFVSGGLTLAALLVYTAEFNDYVRTRFQFETIRETTSMTSGTACWDRIPIALDAAKIMKEHGIAGIGFADYSDYSSFIAFGAQHVFPIASAHNDYLEIGVNTGIVGLAIYLLFIVSFGRKIIFHYRSARRSAYRPVMFACIIIYFVFLLHSFAGEAIVGAFGNGEFMRFSYRVYFWIMMGLAAAIYKIEKENYFGVTEGISNGECRA